MGADFIWWRIIDAGVEMSIVGSESAPTRAAGVTRCLAQSSEGNVVFSYRSGNLVRFSNVALGPNGAVNIEAVPTSIRSDGGVPCVAMPTDGGNGIAVWAVEGGVAHAPIEGYLSGAGPLGFASMPGAVDPRPVAFAGGMLVAWVDDAGLRATTNWNSTLQLSVPGERITSFEIASNGNSLAAAVLLADGGAKALAWFMPDLLDAGIAIVDGGAVRDGGHSVDAGLADGGDVRDSGTALDAGFNMPDSGPDGGGGAPLDAGINLIDGGVQPPQLFKYATTCDCSTGQGALVALLLALQTLRRRRR